KDSARLDDPLQAPCNVCLLRLEVVPVGLLDVVGRVSKNQVHRSRIQRLQPGDRVALVDGSLRGDDLGLELAFAGRLELRLLGAVNNLPTRCLRQTEERVGFGCLTLLGGVRGLISHDKAHFLPLPDVPPCRNSTTSPSAMT